MSLDVCLTYPGEPSATTGRIFVREDGQNKAITVDEWNLRHPDQGPIVAVTAESNTVYSANITHNLGAMAEEAGIYQHCWRPEEIGITKASQLIEPLRKAIADMKAEPPRFRKHDSPNGWGLYENFLPWLERYLEACVEYPEADVTASR